MKFIDTHAHYNDEAYQNRQEEVLKECQNVGVEYIINVGYNKESSESAIQLSEKYDFIYAAIGVHPHDVEKDTYFDIYDIYQANKGKKIVAIGEIGLDYAFVKDNRLAQIDLFQYQIEMANALKLPILIHSRDAALDTYQVIKENPPQYGTLFHCFQPSDDLVRLVLERGYTVAFGGNITYKRNESFAKYVKQIPLEQIVIETDSPYLSPVPYRGTINTSANLPIICKKLAEYKEMDMEYVADCVYQNAIKFFHIK